MSFLAPAQSPEEYIALAWVLEEGTKQFYSKMATKFSEVPAAAQLFFWLTKAEEHHKAELEKLYASISGEKSDPGFPYSLLSESSRDGFLEGGVPIREALMWADGKNAIEALELSISLETIAYDRYLLMEGLVDDLNSKRLFKILSSEERTHVQSITEQFQSLIKTGPLDMSTQ